MFYYPYILPFPFPGYGIPFPPYGWLWPVWQTERSTQDFWWRYLAAKRRNAAAADSGTDAGTGTDGGTAEAAAFVTPDAAPAETTRRRRAAS